MSFASSGRPDLCPGSCRLQISNTRNRWPCRFEERKHRQPPPTEKKTLSCDHRSTFLCSIKLPIYFWREDRVTAMPHSKPKVIAVVGSGIAGLSMARILADAGMQVEIFEARDHLGMDADSVWVDKIRVDAPPRAFNRGFYPNLCALYENTRVEFEKMDWSTAVYADDDRAVFGLKQRIFDRTYWCGKSWSAVLHDCLIDWRIIRDSVVFFASMRFHCLTKSDLSRLSFGDFLDRGGFSKDFIYHILLPVLSMVCTCSYANVLNYPTDILLQYIQLSVFNPKFAHAKNSNYRVKLGTQHAAATLAKGCKVRLSTPVVKVCTETCSIVTEEGGAEKTTSFDRIVIATQANTAAVFFPDSNKDILAALKSVQHEYSTGIMHTDDNAMPKNRADWAPMNMGLTPNSSMFTIWLNHKRQQGLYEVGDHRNIFQVCIYTYT